MRWALVTLVLSTCGRVLADPPIKWVNVYPTTQEIEVPSWAIRRAIAGPQPIYVAPSGTPEPDTKWAAATQPADPAMDFFLNTAKPATQPAAEVPATQPAGEALVNKNAANDARPVTITLSNGQTIKGNAATTTDKPIRVWDESIKDYRDIPFGLIASAKAAVVWERDEKEWQFKESGSDIKVYSGKTYPARETQYTFTLLNGEKITGDVAAPIYFDTGKATKTFVLHKRDKGEPGQKLTDLVYIKQIDFEDKKAADK